MVIIYLGPVLLLDSNDLPDPAKGGTLFGLSPSRSLTLLICHQTSVSAHYLTISPLSRRWREGILSVTLVLILYHYKTGWRYQLLFLWCSDFPPRRMPGRLPWLFKPYTRIIPYLLFFVKNIIKCFLSTFFPRKFLGLFYAFFRQLLSKFWIIYKFL